MDKQKKHWVITFRRDNTTFTTIEKNKTQLRRTISEMLADGIIDFSVKQTIQKT